MKINSAFSLIEIAIVLTIISILVAVTTVVQGFREGAAIKMVVKEVETINIAVDNFNDAFGTLPGDSDQVYNFWSSKCSSASKCNGDSDQIIEAYKESHLIWLHLVLAGFFEGSFSGKGDGDSKTQTEGVNVPKASFPDAQYSILHYHWNNFPDEHMILMGGKISGDIGQHAIIDANSAYNIDAKIDDGKPSTGNVYGRNGWNGNWTTTKCLIDHNDDHVNNSESKTNNVEYHMNISTKECILGFRFKNRIGLDSSRTKTD